MLLGVVSDTHGHVGYTREAIRVLEEFEPQAVLHCGDIGSPEIVRLFSSWPTHFVLGNVDEGEDDITAAIAAAGQHNHGLFGKLELAGRRIAFLHGHDRQRLKQETTTGKWDLVCYGHTHAREWHRNERQTLILNPGALFRATPHSFAIVDLAKLDVTTIEL